MIISGIWAFVFTYCVLWAIDQLTPVKVDPSVEERGLDITLLGEEAYVLCRDPDRSGASMPQVLVVPEESISES